MSTLTRGYAEARKWSDDYESHMSQIAAHIMYQNNLMGVYFVLPTKSEDRKQGIDMYVVTETMKMSYRVRQASALRYFYNGFTIRTSGYLSELSKIQTDMYADYLVYGIASPDRYGVVDAAVMLDMKSIGAQLKDDKSLIERAYKGNGFVDFRYDAFPEKVIVGTYGIDDKGELICQ